MVLRAALRTPRRLLEAAFLARSGQSRSIACSRCSRCPSARASSFTRPAAFLSRHEASDMVRDPTDTSKPPSSLIRMASGSSPKLLRVVLLGCGDPRVGIFLLVAPSYRERAMVVRLETLYDATTVASRVD